MEQKIYINGAFVSRENAKVSVFDHGFLYGDGVFEGIRAYGGKVFELGEHLQRLYRSAHAIALKISLTIGKLERAVLETLRINKLQDAYIRLVISRGEGDLGLDPRKCTKGSIIIIADEIQLYPEEIYKNGLEIITVPTQRNAPESLNPCIKSLNYLNNIMGKIEAINAGVEEAVMLNRDGLVCECTGDNIFIYKDGVLRTPPSYIGALEGITRAVIIRLAEGEGIPTGETPFARYELYASQECFLTGTAAEIVPVVKIDGRQIGAGIPGPTTMRLLKKFREYAKNNGVAIT